MKQIFYIVAKLAVSVIMLALSALAIKHQSSVGFEWAAFLFVMAFFHFIFWPELDKKKH